jgi:LuxR family quorum sensing-dependent transcriptional regulator
MLEIVETYLQALSAAKSDAEVSRVLRNAATNFGFRSAYLIEYAGKLSAIQRVLDTDPERKDWWNGYFASDLRPSPREVAATLHDNTIHRYDNTRFGPGSERLRAACEQNDVIDVTAVPINHAGELVGVAGFCGTVELDRQRQTALQLIVYSAFAHVRTNRSSGDGTEVKLTPRERDVMRLSATGLTSVEIAEQLGMSARTVNQHVDNVADKLGTRNRAHTVAEIVRRGLL